MLNEIVGAKNKEKIMKFLLINENNAFNIVSIAQKTEISVSRVKEILDELTKVKVLSRINKKYQVEKNYITKYLKKLLIPDEIFKEVIDDLKKTFKDKEVSLFLIGSKSRFQERENSDVDFLLICKDDEINEITDIATDTGLKLSDYLIRYVEILTLSKSQLEEIKSRKDPFYLNVFTDHVPIKDDLGVFR